MSVSFFPEIPLSNFSNGKVLRKQGASSRHGIVASQSRTASEVGARVLAQGGNAMDAAIATSFALHVCEPWMSGLGGGGGMLVYDAQSKDTQAIDFPMVAPKSLKAADFHIATGADSDLFGWPGVEGDRNRIGASSVAVPGQVAGMALALNKFGSRDWRDLISPAIELSEAGVAVDWYASQILHSEAKDLNRFDSTRQALAPAMAPPSAPQRGPAQRYLKFHAMTETLKTLRDQGPESFYDGSIAARIAADMGRFGGYLDPGDLARYRARLRPPQFAEFGKARIALLPELTGGDAVAKVLGNLSRLGYPHQAEYDHETVAVLADALKQMWQERLESSGDKARDLADSCTTHLSVVDGDGNMVVMTQTLLSLFGSRQLLPETGLFMNNGLYWFDPRPGRPNSIAGGKRPLANYSPAIAFTEDSMIGLGAAGGRRIIPAVTQILLFMAVHGMTLDQALHHPRIDLSGGDFLVADPRIGADAMARLQSAFHVVSHPPTPIPNAYAIVSAVARSQGSNFGLTEPVNPWGDAVMADQVTEA